MKKIIDDLVVVIFTYNQESYIEESIVSIFDQTVWPRKLYVFDDHSQDGTCSVAEKVLSSAPNGLCVELCKNKTNVGLVTQFNKLINKFNNTLIVVQAGDDSAKKNRLEKQYNVWKTNQEVNLVLSMYDKVDCDGCIISGRDINEKFEHTFENILNRNILPAGCTAAIDSSLFNDFPKIDKNVINEDRVFILRSLLKGKAIKIPESLINYRYDVGISAFNDDSKSGIIKKWKVMYSRESNDLLANIVDCEASGMNEYVIFLTERRKYINLLSDLFSGKFPKKILAWRAFFDRSMKLGDFFDYRRKVRRFFKNIE